MSVLLGKTKVRMKFGISKKMSLQFKMCGKKLDRESEMG